MQFGYFSALHDPDLAIGFSGVLEDFLAELDFVEELGFEGVWTGEHHLGPEGFSNGPNPILLSAYIASRTGLASIGLACVTATIWHPIRLAEDLAMLDHMCKGRLRVGFGRGGYHRDTVPFNVNADPRDPDTARALFDEVVATVLEAWKEPFFSHAGRFYTLPPAGIPHHPMSTTEEAHLNEDGTIARLCVSPKPYQRPHPPIYAMVSSEGSARAAAERGYHCIVAGTAVELIREWTEIYADIRSEREGRTYAPGECWSAQRPLCVAATMEAARESFEPYILAQRRYQSLYRGVEGGKEYARTRLGGATEWTWEVLQDRAMLAGTPDDVGEKLQELEELGIRYVNCWPGAGGYPHRKIMETLALFGSDVLPKFARAA